MVTKSITLDDLERPLRPLLNSIIGVSYGAQNANLSEDTPKPIR